MKKNYLSKFNLQNKKVFVVGGFGLLGSEITELLLENSATVVNLDLSNKKNILTKKKLSKNYFYQKFDISDIENLDKNIDLLIKKFGCPNVFINSSYPVTSNWNLSSFKKNKISGRRLTK